MYSDEIDRTKSQKLYFQLIEIMRYQIGKGGWAVGTQIPTEEQLCQQYNVSKATVRLALAELVSLGFLKKIQGKGTFVRRRCPDNRISMVMNLEDADVCFDTSNIVRVIENKTLRPDKEIGDSLGLSEDDHCYLLSRLVIADSSPLAVQKLYVPYQLLTGSMPDGEVTTISHNHFLESRCNAKIRRMKECADVIHIPNEDADLLEMMSGSPVLRMRQRFYASGETPIGISEALYRTDTYARTVEFERLRM